MTEQVIPIDTFQGVRVLPPIVAEEPSPIAVLENDVFYEIQTALPGVDADDVIIGVVDGVLTIGAKACTETERTLGGFFSIDHRAAMVEQSFALPPDADSHHLTTRFHDGVFSVFLHRTPVSNVVPLFIR